MNLLYNYSESYFRINSLKETLESSKSHFGLRDAHHINEVAVFIISIIVNPTLAILILTERNSGLVAYSRVLLQNCFVDFIYTIVCMASGMQIEFTQGYMVFIINSGFRHLPIQYHYAILFIYSFFCSGAINISTVMFYFRYVLVCKSKILGKTHFALVSALALSGSFIAACTNTHAVRLNEPRRAQMCRTLLSDSLWWETATQRPTDMCMASDTSSASFATFVGLVLIMDTCVYVVMTKCCHAIYSHLKTVSGTYSAKTVKLQRQMNRILLVQMVIPLFTSIIPVGILVFFPILKIDLPGTGLLVTMAFAWVPVISPITTICLVSSFRRRLVRFVGRYAVRRVFGETAAAYFNRSSGINSITPFKS